MAFILYDLIHFRANVTEINTLSLRITALSQVYKPAILASRRSLRPTSPSTLHSIAIPHYYTKITSFNASKSYWPIMCWLTNITYSCRRCHTSTGVGLDIRRCEKARRDTKTHCDLSDCSEVDQDRSSPFDHCSICMAQYNAWLASGKSYTPEPPFF